MQANARAVRERLVGGDEVELWERFEAPDASEGVVQNPGLGGQLRAIIQRHQITATAASLDGTDR